MPGRPAPPWTQRSTTAGPDGRRTGSTAGADFEAQQQPEGDVGGGAARTAGAAGRIAGGTAQADGAGRTADAGERSEATSGRLLVICERSERREDFFLNVLVGMMSSLHSSFAPWSHLTCSCW